MQNSKGSETTSSVSLVSRRYSAHDGRYRAGNAIRPEHLLLLPITRTNDTRRVLPFNTARGKP